MKNYGFKFIFLDSYSPSFPSPEQIMHRRETIIAYGGQIRVDWIIEGYKTGFFPWFNPGYPETWWNPNPRAIMRPSQIRIHKSMRPYLNQVKFNLRIDFAFTQLMKKARQVHTRKDGNTWISDEFIREYTRLHEMGLAHSFEAWKDGQLVGGLYGTSLGKMFFGEAMFSQEKNASKFCFIALAKILEFNGFEYIDCQIQNQHLQFMGCTEVDRDTFLNALVKNRSASTITGNWSEKLKIPPIFEKHFLP